MPQSVKINSSISQTTMADITAEPSVSIAALDAPFLQTLRLVEGRRSLGSARWHCGDPASGVVQILDLTIEPEHQRQGHGGRLLKEMHQRAMEYFRLRRIKPRHAWIVLEQKRQVIARAFVTQHGYHHVATVQDLSKDQDLLVYSRAFG